MLNNIVKLAVWQVAGIGAASAAVTAGVGYGLHRASVEKTQEELETLKKKQEEESKASEAKRAEDKQKLENDLFTLQQAHAAEMKTLRDEIAAMNSAPLTPELINEWIVNLKRGVELVTPVATDALKTAIPVVIGAMAEVKLATIKAEKDVMEKVEAAQKVNEEFIAEKVAAAS